MISTGLPANGLRKTRDEPTGAGRQRRQGMKKEFRYRISPWRNPSRIPPFPLGLAEMLRPWKQGSQQLAEVKLRSSTTACQQVLAIGGGWSRATGDFLQLRRYGYKILFMMVLFFDTGISVTRVMSRQADFRRPATAKFRKFMQGKNLLGTCELGVSLSNRTACAWRGAGWLLQGELAPLLPAHCCHGR